MAFDRPDNPWPDHDPFAVPKAEIELYWQKVNSYAKELEEHRKRVTKMFQEKRLDDEICKHCHKVITRGMKRVHPDDGWYHDECYLELKGAVNVGTPGHIDHGHKREDVMSYNVGDSNYAEQAIQPWDVWEEYVLNPWDADIIKRTLRTKESQSRRMDYEKIKHICDKRISQIDRGIKMYGDIENPVICSNCITAFSDKFNFCPECGEKRC